MDLREKQKQLIKEFIIKVSKSKQNLSDPQTIEELKKSIMDVFRLEVQRYGYRYNSDSRDGSNSFDLELINDPDIEYRGCYYPIVDFSGTNVTTKKPKIRYNLCYLFRGLDSENQDIRMRSAVDVFKTLFHEMHHHGQELMSLLESEATKNSMMFARDMILMSYLGKDYYSFNGATGNYPAYIIENDANLEGYRSFQELSDDADIIAVTLDNFDINQGLYDNSLYLLDVDSRDRKYHYRAAGLHERDDITIPVLDDLICRQKRTEILKIYPVLLNEYNEDGTKKNPVELYRQYLKKESEIDRNPSYSYLKDSMLTDNLELHYELIYRAILKSNPNQIQDFVRLTKNQKGQAFLSGMLDYFETQREIRLDSAYKMEQAQERSNGYVFPYNNGTIRIAKDNILTNITMDEFIKTLDPNLLRKSFRVGIKNTRMSGRELIESKVFKQLPSSGIIKMKDGRIVSPKEFVEKYILQMRDGLLPSQVISHYTQREHPKELYKRTVENIERVYDGKTSVIRQLIQGKTMIVKPSRARILVSAGPNIPNGFKPSYISDLTLASGITSDEITTVSHELFVDRTNDEKINDDER